jgi:non-ribosomal peptide synthase protein (TIGR01720 family)
LMLRWTYSTKHFRESTIRKLALEYVMNLETLIAHCLEQQKSGLVFTPSDFGLGEAISYNELDEFLEEDEDNIMTF